MRDTDAAADRFSPPESEPNLSLGDLAAAFDEPGRDAAANIEAVDAEAQAGGEPAAADAADRRPSSSPPAANVIVDGYLEACRDAGVEPHAWHLEQLRGVPASLVARHAPAEPLRAAAGGAALAAAPPGGPPPSAPQLDALLRAATQPRGGQVALLEHLSLAGAPAGAAAVRLLAGAAEALGSYWRLWSLDARGAGLRLDALLALAALDARPLHAGLERLDLSGNPALGAALDAGGSGAGGGPAGADALAGVAHLGFLWRHAPLRLLDLRHAGLGNAALEAALGALAECAPAGRGRYRHGGARATLECLKLGPPGGGEPASPGVVAALARLAARAPALRVLQVHGLCEAQQEQLAAAWAAALGARAEAASAVELGDGGLRLAAGPDPDAALPVERPPRDHVLPGAEPPRPGAEREADAALDALEEHALVPTSSTAAAGGQLRLSLLAAPGAAGGARPPPPAAAYPVRSSLLSGHGSGGGGGGGGARGGDLASGGGGGAPRLGARAGGGVKRRRAPPAPGAVAFHRGGGRRDALPDFGEDLEGLSQDEARSEDSSSGSDGGSSDGGGGSRGAAPGPAKTAGADPAAGARAHFVARDGERHEDDVAGRHFRREALAGARAAGRAALAAFRAWDMCTNAWDRRRWENPSRDQVDLPESLGALNELLDALEGAGVHLGFPFPGRVRGGGRAAFVAAAAPPRPRAPAPAPAATAAARALAGAPRAAAALPRARAPRPRGASRLVDDGGRGADSGGDESDSDGGGFLAGSDSDSGSGDSQSQPSAGGADAGALADSSPEAAAPRKRVRAVVGDSDESGDDAGGGGAPPGGGAAKKRVPRGVACLASWAWDKHVAEHPPNEAHYALVEGKRARRRAAPLPGVVTGDALADALAAAGAQTESQPPEPMVEALPADVVEAGGVELAAGTSSDDDVPLVRSVARAEAGGPAPASAALPVTPTEPAPGAPGTSALAAVSSAELAARMLGSLYPRSTGKAPERAPADVRPNAVVIPDSEEENNAW